MKANNIPSATAKTVSQVNLNSIIPNNYNPRKIFSETSLSELTESIRQQRFFSRFSKMANIQRITDINLLPD